MQSEGARGLHEDHGNGRKAPQQQTPTDTRPWQRRHRSIRAREGSDVRRAREAPGRRGREASKHSAEADASQKRQTDLSRKTDQQVRRSRVPSDEDHVAEFKCMRGWPPRSSARERHSPCEAQHMEQRETEKQQLSATVKHEVVCETTAEAAELWR